MPQVTIKHKFIHQAPRKLRLVSDSIRGLPATTAVAELGTVTQLASVAVRKAVLSAIAAAKEQGLNLSQLLISEVMVDEGPKLRRAIPRSKGRSLPILKRMSHLTISLTDEALVLASSMAFKKEKLAALKALLDKIEPMRSVEPIAAARSGHDHDHEHGAHEGHEHTHDHSHSEEPAGQTNQSEPAELAEPAEPATEGSK